MQQEERAAIDVTARDSRVVASCSVPYVDSHPNQHTGREKKNRKKIGASKDKGGGGLGRVWGRPRETDWASSACVRNSWFLVTVEPVSVWPLPLWRQCRGNTADGWLAGASASLWYTAGRAAQFVSIKRRRMGAAEARVTVFVFHLHSPVAFLLCPSERHTIEYTYIYMYRQR